MKRPRLMSMLVIAAATAMFAGCSKESPQDGGGTGTTATSSAENGHEHEHPSEGPHHGSLIELGNEEYHGELVHDEESGKVTIYILDGSATQAVPIDAGEVTVNLVQDGKPEQFQLMASPDEGDPQGKSSRFVTEDKALGTRLDAEGAEARLTLQIEGKSYSGKIAHDHGAHDHAGHAH